MGEIIVMKIPWNPLPKMVFNVLVGRCCPHSLNMEFVLSMTFRVNVADFMGFQRVQQQKIMQFSKKPVEQKVKVITNAVLFIRSFSTLGPFRNLLL